MANRKAFQIIHRGGEIKTMPRRPDAPVPLVGADGVPALVEEEPVSPLVGDEGVLAATGEIEVIPVDTLSGPVSDPLNSEPIYA